MISKRFILASAGILLSYGIALAQGWGVGASVGLTNDVDHRFALDEFRRHDVNAWVQYELELNASAVELWKAASSRCLGSGGKVSVKMPAGK